MLAIIKGTKDVLATPICWARLSSDRDGPTDLPDWARSTSLRGTYIRIYKVDNGLPPLIVSLSCPDY